MWRPFPQAFCHLLSVITNHVPSAHIISTYFIYLSYDFYITEIHSESISFLIHDLFDHNGDELEEERAKYMESASERYYQVWTDVFFQNVVSSHKPQILWIPSVWIENTQ